MSHSQFHCTGRVYLDLHGLIFETSICYWQDQPGSPPFETLRFLCGERGGATEVSGRRADARLRLPCALLPLFRTRLGFFSGHGAPAYPTWTGPGRSSEAGVAARLGGQPLVRVRF